ncbi:hypothetical protein [Ferrimicrobium acidiphilum]|uniref:hypothetical protein n=1 Tax=Ferrimicrobium acidiphilum TaxID=121039 RepID=UPI0023F454EB|nr:hypothetical protein [Ferrimicrobium acidiphilum]
MRTLAEFRQFRPLTVGRIEAALDADSSSYLLKGPRGCGADELLGAIAQALLGGCGGCGHCWACREVADGEHPDVLWAQGERGKAVAVEELRRVVRFASLAPVQARYRVVIIPDIDTLRLTFPVILKALEEPPTATKWLLSAALIEAELSPVASRCFTVELEAPSDDEIEERFREANVHATAALVRWTRRRLDRVSLFARLTDAERYLSTFQDLPELVRDDARWCMELVHRLTPEDLGNTGDAEEVIQCGLEILIAAHPENADWLRRATRASLSLSRHLPVQLVLAELILRAG